MKVKSECEVAQSCPTLSDPVGCSLPGSPVHGIFQARVREWGAIAFSTTDIKHCQFKVYNFNISYIYVNVLPTCVWGVRPFKTYSLLD